VFLLLTYTPQFIPAPPNEIPGYAPVARVAQATADYRKMGATLRQLGQLSFNCLDVRIHQTSAEVSRVQSVRVGLQLVHIRSSCGRLESVCLLARETNPQHLVTLRNGGVGAKKTLFDN